MFTPLEFVRFLKNPHLPHERRETNLFGTAILIYLYTFFFIGLIGVGIRSLLELFFTLPADETLVIPPRYIDHLWIYFILISIILPVLEELMFRLSLIFKPIHLTISVSILTSLCVHTIANEIITMIVFLLLFLMIYHVSTVYKLYLISFWNRNFKFLFYGLSIFFGLVHITNYTFTMGYQYLISPFLVFPQIAVGFILSFTRIFYKKGFLIGILYHVTLNTISFSFLFLTQNK
jgi:hypothetical protein